MPANLARQTTLLMTNSNSCTASFTQMAAIEALCGDQLSVNLVRDEFIRSRDVIVQTESPPWY
jgi:aspartate aminotransferase